jgi:hypothetical protein
MDKKPSKASAHSLTQVDLQAVGLDCRTYCTATPGVSCQLPARGDAGECLDTTSSSVCPF